MLLQTFFKNKNFQDTACLIPFTTISIAMDGGVSLCGCYHWMPTEIGNIYQNTLTEILSTDWARDIRNSIRDGSFIFCDETACGAMANGELPRVSELEAATKNRVMLDGSPVKFPGYDLFKDESLHKQPTTFYIAGDAICNLSCPSCRTHVISETQDDRALKNQKFNILINNLFGGSSDEVITVCLSTTGEVFSSKTLFGFLKYFPLDRYPNVEFKLQTNGLLFAKRWPEIEYLAHNIHEIAVTSDSCRPETYEKLRRGGKFADIEKNLQLMSAAKQQYGFRIINRMVVQLDNHTELTDFYAWSKSLGVDYVEYLKLTNWGTFTEAQFQNLDVLNPDHVCYAATVSELRQLQADHQDVRVFGFNMHAA